MNRACVLALLLVLAAPAAAAGRPAGAAQCYASRDRVECLLERAKSRLDRVADVGERAEAAAELLYAQAATGRQDAAPFAAALALADRGDLAPRREMGLLYAIDLYQFATESPLATASYAAAAKRFRDFETLLQGRDLLELYVGACAMLGWEESFLERWWDFVPEACNAAKLAALAEVDPAARIQVLALLPAALTAADDWDGYTGSAEAALVWLDGERRRKTKAAPRGESLDRIGVAIYGINALSLDLFDQPQAAAAAAERSRLHLRRVERRSGINGRSTPLRREVAEALFRAGREQEATRLVRQMVVRADADPTGRRIGLAEQVAILALAARLADLGAVGSCPAPPPGDIKET